MIKLRWIDDNFIRNKRLLYFGYKQTDEEKHDEKVNF